MPGMNPQSKIRAAVVEALETRRLMAWSGYAQLVHQDQAASDFSSVTGKGTTVAVLDTGVDYSIKELGGGFGAGYKVVGGYDFYDDDADPMDESGHGTNTASVIAARTYTVDGVTYRGVAPDAKLVALRVGTEDSISDYDIEDALQWVIKNHKTFNISVVNISLGSGFYPDSETSDIMSDEFAQLKKLGIFVAAASGNSNDQISGPINQDGIAYPAADPNVFAVGAVNSSDVIADWAQRGDELDLLAPGVDITMPKMGGGYVTEDGTSFASPYVAGTAALIKQLNPKALAGDIGSILMTAGRNNRDGDQERGNTTTLAYSRLDIENALRLTKQRAGVYSNLNFGSRFDTALDSNGVLHAAYYDAGRGRLLYTTRDTSGLWSKTQIVDDQGNVGYELSLAVDNTGKVGIGYYDATNSAVKCAQFNGTAWSTQTVESSKSVGQSPSLAFDIDGNVYLGYYRKSSGDLRLALLDRDTGAWTRKTIDGADGADVGRDLSVDAGEAAVRGNFGFTQYDTTVAIAYADTTNGDLKYARLDLDDPTATWYISTVDNAKGVANIDLNLHAGPTAAGLQAQIAYQDTSGADVKYAYRNQDWFTETVRSAGKVGDTVQLTFNDSDDPVVTYYDRTRKSLYTATRQSATRWTLSKTATASGPMALSLNERTGETVLSWLNRPKSSVFSSQLI
ncbi:MAG TPA: S8 family serine peptidase [Tepidisphaeraceae bacterium]